MEDIVGAGIALQYMLDGECSLTSDEIGELDEFWQVWRARKTMETMVTHVLPALVGHMMYKMVVGVLNRLKPEKNTSLPPEMALLWKQWDEWEFWLKVDYQGDE